MDANPAESSDQPEFDPVDADIRRVCGILQSVAERFPPDSDESIALRDAAHAYQLVQFHKSMKKSYDKLRSLLGGQPTDEMIDEMNAHLRRHGIDPDDFEDDD